MRYFILPPLILVKYVYIMNIFRWSRYHNAFAAYCSAALVQLFFLWHFNLYSSPGTLRSVLGFVFISQIALGLEPGAVKGAVLSGQLTESDVVPLQLISTSPLFKAITITPLIVVLWYLGLDTEIKLQFIFFWTVSLFALGFCTNEMRSVLDLYGSYGAAVWLKQGGSSFSFLILFFSFIMTRSIELSFTVSLIARALLLVAFIFFYRKYLTGFQKRPLHDSKRKRDRQWRTLMAASVLSAIGGSSDRFAAFRYLTPQEVGIYVLVYEAFTKIWLVPYLVGPIIFVQYARGSHQNRLFFNSVTGIAIGTIGLILGLLFINLALPEFFGAVKIEKNLVPYLAVFLAAISVSAVAQLFVARIQGSGSGGLVPTALSAHLVISLVLFWASSMHFGLKGLFIAWLIKSAIELVSFVFILNRKSNHGFH